MLIPARDLPLLAALRLRVPVRTLRSLVTGDHAALRGWLAAESALRLAEARRDARLDFAALEALGARIVTPADPDWPPGFADLPDPPAFLIVRGPLPPGGTAVIGAREAAEEERVFARTLAAALQRPIVAGLAPGIDEAAHRGALDAGQPTVAYLGSGLARAEDPALAEAIVAGGGALASEYGPAAPATPWTRKRRDRLQAAHASAVVLVVSDAEGGAMHTLRFAREYGRARFVLDAEASGNRIATAEGAAVLPWETAAAARILAALA
ncbi:MAG: processing protein [Candidatus Eremiobacteraeota bacterium]|nr:processing protein [Candidatus Eremiobacteraeota bacterium]